MKLKKQKKTIVLVGGCFDIFHYGHFFFLSQAKKLGDILMVALESDQKIQELKGKDRPITPFKWRANLLANFDLIDYVLLLPYLKNDLAYFKLIEKLKPTIIAATQGDPQLKNKQKQANLVGGQLKIIPYLKNFSTSQLLKIMQTEN